MIEHMVLVQSILCGLRKKKREIGLGANWYAYCLKKGVGARSVSLRVRPCSVGNFSKADLTISSEVLACQSATMSNWPGVVHASIRPGKLLGWLTNVSIGLVTLKRLMPSGIWFWKWAPLMPLKPKSDLVVSMPGTWRILLTSCTISSGLVCFSRSA